MKDGVIESYFFTFWKKHLKGCFQYIGVCMDACVR